MTEYETALLALQDRSLALQEASLVLQEASIALQELSIWATVGVGLLHAALIGCGLWMMLRASADRNRAMDEDWRAADLRHEETEKRQEDARKEARQRHEEAMAALKALIERTAPSPRPASAG